MSVNLQYNYATIDLDTGLCLFCRTYSYEIPLPEYIPVPTLGDYTGKYYSQDDELWYLDAEFTQLWDEAPQW